MTLRRHESCIRIFCDAPQVPRDDGNLAAIAAASLLGPAGAGADILIDKRIPVGAGLGGGSADAAGALVGINRLYDLRRSKQDLEFAASTIGADVKFMLQGGCALGVGRGDDLAPLPTLPGGQLVLVVPDVTVSTAWAYESLKMGLTTGETDLTMITSALGQGDVASLSDFLHNDFERLIFDRFPFVETIKQDLLRLGADCALMSGSGPVVYGVFSEEVQAQRCRKQFLERGHTTLIASFVEHGVTVTV
jgi:4-diphosphocytidyl-2-C-methyl-D-erythritol kinase